MLHSQGASTPDLKQHSVSRGNKAAARKPGKYIVQHSERILNEITYNNFKLRNDKQAEWVKIARIVAVRKLI